jgi:Tol biopolymer transport system component
MRIASIGAVVSVLVLLSFGAAAQAAFPGRNGRIWYEHHTANVDPDYPPFFIDSLESAKFTGSKQNRGPYTLLSCQMACGVGATALAPDGRLIAFNRAAPDDEPGGDDMWVVEPDGSGLRRLAVRGWSPGWSPNGRRLVFEQGRVIGGASIYIMRLDGGGLRRLTHSDRDGTPAWSTRGLIAFQRQVGPGGANIFTVRPDGRGLRRLTRHGGYSPEWSPDGKRLAFDRIPAAGRSDIYVMRAGGGGLRRLTNRGGSHPAWSPDGRWIAFIRNAALWVMRANGRAQRLLLAPRPTGQPNLETIFDNPDWQPLPLRRSS